MTPYEIARVAELACFCDPCQRGYAHTGLVSCLSYICAESEKRRQSE